MGSPVPMGSDLGFQESQWPCLHGGAVSGPTPAGVLCGGPISAGALCLGLLLWDPGLEFPAGGSLGL